MTLRFTCPECGYSIEVSPELRLVADPEHCGAVMIELLPIELVKTTVPAWKPDERW